MAKENSYIGGYVFEEDGYTPVAGIAWREDNQHEEHAKLIVAAPDLLEACKQAFAILDADRNKFWHTSSVLKQAITKATKQHSKHIMLDKQM